MALESHLHTRVCIDTGSATISVLMAITWFLMVFFLKLFR